MRNVDRILADWQEWDTPWSNPPKILRALIGGSTNESYLIAVDGGRWVLRLNTCKSSKLAVDRAREETIVKHAAAAGIAPTVGYCSVQAGVLITEFVDGVHWDKKTITDPGNLSQLINLLQSVHTLDVDTPAINYFMYAEQYWAALNAEKIKIPQRLQHERSFIMGHREYDFLNSQGTHLCHHDLSPSNIIQHQDRLYLLDWEYAARGSRTFDYAGFLTEWEISIDQIQKYESLDPESIRLAARLYRYICQLWRLLNASR
ncbi:MAG TPA: hypothetical protein DGR97_14440 [Gammaproteobacteria bacterium]|nr:hypothetical protein [Gammaproteobacteria bacterium]